jgi:hypothetical protein
LPPRPLAAACPKAAGQRKGPTGSGIPNSTRQARELGAVLLTSKRAHHSSSTPALSTCQHQRPPVCCNPPSSAALPLIPPSPQPTHIKHQPAQHLPALAPT